MKGLDYAIDKFNNGNIDFIEKFFVSIEKFVDFVSKNNRLFELKPDPLELNSSDYNSMMKHIIDSSTLEQTKIIVDNIIFDYLTDVVKIDDKHLPIFNKQRQKYSGKKYIYYLTGPDGVKYNDISDIKQFCIDHGLVRNNIMTMAQKEKKYMGWTGYRKTIECKRETNRGAEQRDNERKAKILEDQKNMKETLIEDILKWLKKSTPDQ
jgi:hypothetical protein